MRYLAQVFWSDEDEGDIAVVPDLPGCPAFGNAPEEAVREIGDATLAWIAACRAAGDPVPGPTTKARLAHEGHASQAVPGTVNPPGFHRISRPCLGWSA